MWWQKPPQLYIENSTCFLLRAGGGFEDAVEVDAVEQVPSPLPSELPAFQALLWEMGAQGVDMRPHIFDKTLNQFLLLDTGAQISACPPDPGGRLRIPLYILH